MEEERSEGSGSGPDQLAIKSKSTSTIKDPLELPKIKPPKGTQKISKLLKNRMRPKKRATQKYFTAAAGVNEYNAINVEKEPSPYKYPEDLEMFAYKVKRRAWRDDAKIKELNAKCYEKPSYQDRHRKGLLNRLYVKEPKVESVKTILDVDPQYFSTIEGRPIPDNLDIRTYIDLVRETLRTKIICGYREDDIMLIQENHLLEQKMIDKIKDNLQAYINTFEEFLYRDHTSAMDLLKESEDASAEFYEKYEQYKVLAKEYGSLRSSVYKSEEKWRNCKLYQKFLHTISPMSWKQGRRRCKRASVFLMQEDSNEDIIFGRYKTSFDENDISLSNIIRLFREEMAEEKEPELYFTDPEQLMDVFRFIEMQNLHSLLHSEELAIPLDNVKESMRMAEKMFDEEISVLQEAIDRLAGDIRILKVSSNTAKKEFPPELFQNILNWEEERARHLEEFAQNLIKNEFRELVESEEVLNLHVFVEDVYETRIGPNDANLSMLEMMKGIEEKYRQELLLLDKVPSEQVALLEGSCYDEQMRIMRLAEKAAKQYTELERMTYKLNIAVGPPFKKEGGKEPKKRSPLLEPPKEVEHPPRTLTEQEEEYLEYFTDFCKFTDDPNDYGIDTKSEMEKNPHKRQAENIPLEQQDSTEIKLDQFNELKSLREMIRDLSIDNSGSSRKPKRIA